MLLIVLGGIHFLHPIVMIRTIPLCDSIVVEGLTLEPLSQWNMIIIVPFVRQ